MDAYTEKKILFEMNVEIQIFKKYDRINIFKQAVFSFRVFKFAIHGVGIWNLRRIW